MHSPANVQATGQSEGAGYGIIDFGAGKRIAIVVESAGNTHSTVVEQGGGVRVARHVQVASGHEGSAGWVVKLCAIGVAADVIAVAVPATGHQNSPIVEKSGSL